MPRVNFKEIEKAINMAASAATKQLRAERAVDAQHIDEHVTASKHVLEQLAEVEKSLLDYTDQCRAVLLTAFDNLRGGIASSIGELRAEEQKRLAALQLHAADIRDDGSKLIEPSEKLRVIS